VPSGKYSIRWILTPIVNRFRRGTAISENARYFRPGKACNRSDAGYIDALLIFQLPPSHTSNGRVSQNRSHFANTQPTVQRQGRKRLE
jgi:hypothetical protein